MTNSIMLRKREIPFELIEVPVVELAFYPENPRIYSQFVNSNDRTQQNIQQKLEQMEHVRDLRSQIDRDGQVNEPLFCMEVPNGSMLRDDYRYQVLEGNSRLAALRIEKKGTLPPTHVPCNILDFSAYDETIRESLIFSLLGQFHIVGKTNWQSYENGAYIYRRFQNQRVSEDEIAKEIGLTPARVRQMINAFGMMQEAGDANASKWSYYEAYASSRKLQNLRNKHSDFHDRVISCIKGDKFPRAMDMRDKLPAIMGNKRSCKVFLDPEVEEPFEDALAIADLSGDTDAVFRRLQRFRKDLAQDTTQTQVRKLLQKDSSRGQTEYELERVVKSASQLLARNQKKPKGSKS